MSTIGHALVIDDKYDDGMLICTILIKNLTPCYFFQFDEKTLADRIAQNPPKLNSIRVIFQDLALISAGEPGKNDYEAATTTIESIVSENNGPWLLVTWSTWAGAESGFETKKADELFNHLRENLKPTQAPYAYVSLDTKPQFTSHGTHSEVERYDLIEPAKINELTDHILAKSNSFPATKSLLSWEVEVFRAISETISEITSFIKPGTFFDADLGSILYEMALAEIGKNVAPENMKKGIKEVLSSILRDKISATMEGLEKFNTIDIDRHVRLENWKAKTNRIIHLEELSIDSPLPPGSVINISQHFHLLPSGNITEEEFGKFLRCNFLQFSRTENLQKAIVTEACTLVALDITPPCDHAQNKSPWNKYLVGIKIPKNYSDFCNAISGGERQNKLIGEYLIKLPEMISNGGEHYHFIFNSKLTFALNSSFANEKLAPLILGRLREQMLADINSWLIRQTTRPGIVEIR
ncbi:hypothetical protein [Pseudomonas sp. FP198]|uniref:hypothetical protein n=1 Tax=Pseudomonas sp. FP198 TaxID=2954084 RepID=UPI002734756A|nr:hypothetical protein [Pseudomonas sp. FP198]WLG97090.1 hypothetical protein PSH78_06805 [Pseudomonas sp. FP198]